jgi:hypothetical protein
MSDLNQAEVPTRRGVRWERVGLTAVLALALGLSVVSLVSDPSSIATLVLLGTPYAAVGTLLALRRPRHPIGWIFLAIVMVWAISTAAEALGGTDVQHGANLPNGFPMVLIWIETWIFSPVLFALYYTLTVVFPSGHLPGGRIGRAVRISFLVPLAGVIAGGFGPHLGGPYAPDTIQSGVTIDNPVGFLPVDLGNLTSTLTILLLVAGVIGMVVRFRRARGLERQQLRWFVAAMTFTAAVIALAIIVIFTAPDGAGVSVWFFVTPAYVLIPLALGGAIMRYRLYDLDRIISRTISWAVVSGVLAVVFVAVILASQTLLSSVTASNTVAVAASTLVVAGLFQPLRRRVQVRVDRRFNRARYDAERTVAVFADRLRDEADLAELGHDIRTTVTETVQPVSVSLWLRASGPQPG